MNSAKNIIEDFQKKRFRKSLVLGLLSLVAVGALFFSFFIIKEEVGRVRAALIKRSYIIEQLNSVVDLSKNSDSAATLLEKLDEIVPTTIEIPVNVVPKMNSIAQANNLRSDFQIGLENQIAGLSVVDFSARADGALKNIINFISALENATKVVAIKDWRIESLGDGYQIIFSGSIYARSK